MVHFEQVNTGWGGTNLLDHWIDFFLPWKQNNVQCQQKRYKFNPLQTDASSHRHKPIELDCKSTEWYLHEDNINPLSANPTK